MMNNQIIRMRKDVWHFDMECIEEEDAYTQLMMNFIDLAKGDLPLENIGSNVDFDREEAAVTFHLDGQRYQWQVTFQDDWVDVDLFKILWIVFFIIVILEMYWRNKKARSSQIQENTREDTQAKEAHTEINIDDLPDLPVPFGYKCQWMVVRSTDSEEIANRLNLTDIRRANWKTGIKAAYQELIFISSPIKGYIHNWFIVA